MNNFFNLFKKNQPKPKYKKILSLDGGGVRAIAGIIFLKKLEAASGKKIFDTFDMFVGTSAGALNAACFAYGKMTADEVKRYWSKDYLDRIMKTSFFWDKASLIQARPRYETEGRVEVLKEIFSSHLLNDVKKPLVTLTYDIEKRTHVIHSSFDSPNISIIDAVCASSAAPMYFPTYQMENGSWMIDGGVVTNNPSMIGFAQAKEYFQTDRIKILSIGAGLNKKKIDGETSSIWGGVGWLRNDIMGMMLDSEIHHDIAEDILDQSYLRINSSLGKINKILDDSSDNNLEKIHLMGMDWWSEFGKETIEFLKD
tara:strand:+ start:3461 stop:4396 length:936 start_codon:yes stop_codon:yes gene_type:complete